MLERAKHEDFLDPLIVEQLKKWPRDELCEKAQQLHCPILPVNDASDIVKSEHLAARDLFAEIEHPKAGKLKYVFALGRFSKTPYTLIRSAPLLGQHNEEVYCQRLGYTRQDVLKMRQTGVI
jgi:crotonobetainyl-CoA:carnitine CoA-transferase CaiB-like acyl-CoA transferase